MYDNLEEFLGGRVMVDIICAVYNGARFLPDLLQSLEQQSHTAWRLWVRDDGSTDASVELVRSKAASEPRIHMMSADGASRLGPTQSFARLLERVPADAGYVMFADQDDVWLPQKIERTLGAMQEAERAAPGLPVLVHTDLIVTDESLRAVHSSFWAFAALKPEAVTLRRLAVQNCTTGAATMINRELRERAGKLPAAAAMHDWWCAMVAAAFGRVIAVHEPTILYRQHGANAVGARDARFPLHRLPVAIVSRLGNVAEFRRGLRQSADQAGAFLERYGAELTEDDRQFLASYAAIPQQPLVQRKLDLLRFRTLPEHGVLQTLGVLIRG